MLSVLFKLRAAKTFYLILPIFQHCYEKVPGTAGIEAVRRKVIFYEEKSNFLCRVIGLFYIVSLGCSKKKFT